MRVITKHIINLIIGLIGLFISGYGLYLNSNGTTIWNCSLFLIGLLIVIVTIRYSFVHMLDIDKYEYPKEIAGYHYQPNIEGKKVNTPLIDVE